MPSKYVWLQKPSSASNVYKQLAAVPWGCCLWPSKQGWYFRFSFSRNTVSAIGHWALRGSVAWLTMSVLGAGILVWTEGFWSWRQYGLLGVEFTAAHDARWSPTTPLQSRSENILGWKGTTRIIRSNSRRCSAGSAAFTLHLCFFPEEANNSQKPAILQCEIKVIQLSLFLWFYVSFLVLLDKNHLHDSIKERMREH